MARYKVGDEVLVKGTIIDELDSDGDYEVRITYGDDDFDWEDLYIKPKDIVGKVNEYSRNVKYAVGDVLDNHGSICVITTAGKDNCIVTFKDGSGGYRSIGDLDRYFVHTGKNIAEEVHAVLDVLANECA